MFIYQSTPKQHIFIFLVQLQEYTPPCTSFLILYSLVLCYVILGGETWEAYNDYVMLFFSITWKLYSCQQNTKWYPTDINFNETRLCIILINELIIKYIRVNFSWAGGESTMFAARTTCCAGAGLFSVMNTNLLKHWYLRTYWRLQAITMIKIELKNT